MEDYDPKTSCMHGPSFPPPRNPAVCTCQGIIQGPLSNLLASSGEMHFESANKLAAVLYRLEGQMVRGEPLISAATVQMFLGSSVDAFLNHDFPAAFSFWCIYKLYQACMKAKEVYLRCKPAGFCAEILPSECLFQLMLLPRHIDDTVTSWPPYKTPWGTVNYFYRTGTLPPLDIYQQFNNDATSTVSEERLLRNLKANVPCRCLDAEDPSVLDFKMDFKNDPSWRPGVGVEPTQRRLHTTCMKCDKKPLATEKFPICGRCKMVRYCAADCQRQDWSEHKKVCGKQPAWWNRPTN
jgi:hypothetical protein